MRFYYQHHIGCYSAIAILSEAKFVEIPSSIDNDFKITPAQLEAAITPKTKMVFLTHQTTLVVLCIVKQNTERWLLF